MITYKQVDKSYFPQYDQVPMTFEVKSYYRIDKHDRGLGGFTIVETPVDKPYIKDFNMHGECADNWTMFDLTNWAFFMAFDMDKPIGAAAVTSRTKEIYMLDRRNDLAVLWDIRVSEKYKGQGVGQKLFDMVVTWARNCGLVQLKIECQNNNVAACKFYHKQGAVLCKIDEYAYYNEPAYRHEAMFIWYLDL